jgi:molecular chaperone GrpE
MTEQNDEQAQEPVEPSDVDAQAPEPAGEEPAAETPTLEQLQHERDELEDRLKRVSADYQNYMRRAQQNVTTAQQQQLMSVAKSLVSVLDHFDNALAVDPEATSPQKMMEGVQMVRDELLRVLGGHGVERIEATVGEPFDPNRHEAMMRQPTDQVEPDHVAMQMQPGYALAEMTIRPAKVAVAQAPEGQGQSDADADADAEA